jgi:branched-chain amino acid transport system permease protein
LVRRLYRSPELSILGTFGLAIVLRQLAQLLFGPQFRLSDNPIPGPTSVLGVLYPSYKLLLIAIAVVVLFAVAATLQFTPLGVRVRAVAADNALAQTLGVRATRLNLIVFAASAALAALAGLLVAPVSTVSPTMGESYLFTAFIAVIVGGTRVWGVLVAALVIAAVENLATSWYDPIVARVAMLVLAFVALQWFRRTPVREAV